jgi:hypothetical protein
MVLIWVMMMNKRKRWIKKLMNQLRRPKRMMKLIHLIQRSLMKLKTLIKQKKQRIPRNLEHQSKLKEMPQIQLHHLHLRHLNQRRRSLKRKRRKQDQKVQSQLDGSKEMLDLSRRN